LRDHWRPALRDPMLIEERARTIAERSNATPSMVRQLAALTVPSSCTNPFAIVRELWLDRGFLFLALCFAAWQVVLHVNIAWPISPLWVFPALVLVFPPYLVYATRIQSTVFVKPLLTTRRAELIQRITGAHNVIFGHSHKPEEKKVGPVQYVNGGFWSPAFAEPECKHRIGTQTFVWVRPGPEGVRQAQLFEWPPGGDEARAYRPEPTAKRPSRPAKKVPAERAA
jgi:hypothetical protein